MVHSVGVRAVMTVAWYPWLEPGSMASERKFIVNKFKEVDFRRRIIGGGHPERLPINIVPGLLIPAVFMG